MEFHRRVAIAIKKIRMEKGLSQEQVLVDTRIHIARIEMGTFPITLHTVDKLCKYFNISFKEFAERSGL